MADKPASWQPPDKFTAKPTEIAGWAQEIIEDGERWLQTRPSFRDMGRGIDMIEGRLAPETMQNRSELTTNRAKRSVREIVAALADTRYLDGYSSDNKAFAPECEMLNKLNRAIYFESRFQSAIKQVCQWFSVGGSGYLYPRFRRARMGPGAPLRLCFDPFGPGDVVPFMIPSNNNFQGCYAQSIIVPMPLPEAHAKFPTFQHKLKAITKSRRRMKSPTVITRLEMLSRLRGDSGNSLGAWSDQYCEIRYTLVRDMRINVTNYPIPMGDPGASWSYIVPALGADIPTSTVENGKRKMRKAMQDDCYLYPQMRLIVTGTGVDVPLYDGPAYDWHGMFPPRFSGDDWPWEPLGYSLIRDIFDMERTRQFAERAIDTVVRARLDPVLGYDTDKINPGTAEEFDPFEARKRLGLEGSPAGAIEPMLPQYLLEVPAFATAWLEYLAKSEDYQLGVNQLDNFAKAQMGMGNNDGIEDMVNLAGPIVRDISAGMEGPMGEVMEMNKFLYLQYFDTARTMRYVGPDGVTPETLDFDPNSLVPSHMPGEDATGASQFTRRERAKIFAENLRTTVVPGALHGATQTSQKLLYMQLQRSGFPISSETVAKALDLPNFGTIDGATEYEKWCNEQKMKLIFASQMKDLESSLEPAGPAAGPPEPAVTPHAQPGRPPSGQKPPMLRTKASAEGPRATITES